MKLTINAKTGKTEIGKSDEPVLESNNWHHPRRPVRLVFTKDQDFKFRLDPTLRDLYNFLMSNPDIPVNVEAESIYVYLNYLLATEEHPHRQLLEANNVVIENKN